MAEYLKILQELTSLPSELHWFCSIYDGGQDTSQVKSENTIDYNVDLRQEQACDCLRLFAYDSEEALPYQDRLAVAIDKQMSRCDLCVLGYYKSRKRLIEQLKNEYDEDDVALLLANISARDIQRIKRGLEIAARNLRGTDSSGRHKDILNSTCQLALFEALCCEAFLSNGDLLEQYFQEPFKMVQTNRRLKVSHYVPAATMFLFDTDHDRSEWATWTWSKYKIIPTEDDFDFAIRDNLMRTMQLVPEIVADIDFLQRLWSGVRLILDKLDNNLITHSLRAIEIDVFRLALEHLKYDKYGFRFLVQTIQKLLELAPTDFWDSMGPISPTTVIEQVFNNPRYDRFLQEAKESDKPQSSALYDMLDWIRPFMYSLETAHQAGACRSLAFQLLDRLQADRFSLYTRLECKYIGLDTLSWTLKNCNDTRAGNASDGHEGGTLSHTGRIVAAETLEVVSAYIKDIINIPGLPAEDKAQESCAETCLVIIKQALTLECISLRTDQEALRNDRELPNGFNSYSPAIWDAVVQHLDCGNITVARAALVGINDLIGLEKFKVNAEDVHSKEKSNFNVKLGRLSHLVCQILERINDFDPEDLDKLFRLPDTATALVASLFSPDANLYEAGVNLIKSSSFESTRRDAIGYLLKTSFETTLNAFSWSLKRVAENKTFASCPRMLKTCTDVLDILCDTQNGLLRTKQFSRASDTTAIECYWQHQWEALGVIYNETENWSRAKATDTQSFKDFCRDTMQLSEQVFDEYSVFANAIDSAVQVETEKGSTATKERVVGKALVQHPAKMLEAITKWLRLRDEYLMETSVKLTKKVLGRLTGLGMTVAERPRKFLEQVLVNAPSARTNISPQEKAEIARALEANEGHPISTIVDEDRELSETLSDRSGRNSLPVRKFRRDGAIDLDTWRSNAKAPPRLVEISDDEFGDSDIDRQLLSIDQSTRLLKGKEATPTANNASVQARKGKTSMSSKRDHIPIKPVKPSGPSDADRALFREKREKEREAKKKRDADSIALLKRKASGISGQTVGEGSSLANVGVRGKDHAPKISGIMVSSESESDPDDEVDHVLFGNDAKNLVSSKIYKDLDVKSGMQAKAKAPIKKTRQIRSAKDMRARLAPDLTSLHKTILSWDFFHNDDFPPGSERNDYSLVSHTFRTPIDYQRTFEPLLILEAWQGFLKSKEEGNFKVFEVKVANRMTVDAFVELSTTMPMTEGKEQGIGEADVILMSKGQSPADEARQPHCLARVHKISRKKALMEITYRVNVGNGLVSSMIPNGTLYAVKISSMTPLEREYGALLGLQYFDLCDEVIRARPSPLLDYSKNQLGPLVTNYGINNAQAKAVRSAIDNDAFTLIQGPPGSGKTKTIVAIVGALLTGQFGEKGVPIALPHTNTGKSHRTSSAAATKKLLVCAPSNAAVDELVTRFKEGVKTVNGSVHTLSVIRLGRSDAINANVRDVTLEELVNAKLNPVAGKKNTEGDELHEVMKKHKEKCDEFNALRTQVDEAKSSGKPVTLEQDRTFELLRRAKQQLSNRIDTLRDSGDTVARDADLRRRHVQQEILNDAHVICATLSGSGHEMFQNLKIEFETVIIDEAAQSIELSALIPLKYGCSKCVLVGDPKQLPPTVLSREAARFQYEQSLFVRMQANHPNDVHLLDTQYRMHPEISVFPSNTFYDSRLLDGADMAELRKRPWHQSKILGPYRFFDVQGSHESAPQGHSLVNYAEIEVALSLFERLITDCKGYDFKGKVGIITPYKSQLKQLRFRFAHKYSEAVLNTVEFNTTDAFQGRESEVIIFSCVRASVNKGIGFLSDIRRMNVGITRAKCSLWVLGNSQSLMRGDFWGRLIQDAKSRDRYTGGDLLGLLKKPLLHFASDMLPVVNSSDPSDTSSGDIDMPDAPIIVRLTSTSRLSSDIVDTSTMEEYSFGRIPIDPTNKDIRSAADTTALSYRPSGGANGFNTKAFCQKCGSFEHYTHLCKEVDIIGECHRCGINGHRKIDCYTQRCISCGHFGHIEQTCTSNSVIASKEKSRIIRQEEEHRHSQQNVIEHRRKSQLGGHDVKVPVIHSTPDSPPHVVRGGLVKEPPQERIGEKRRRGSSPPTIAPKGPRLMNGATKLNPQNSRPPSRGSNQMLSRPPDGSLGVGRKDSSAHRSLPSKPADVVSKPSADLGLPDDIKPTLPPRPLSTKQALNGSSNAVSHLGARQSGLYQPNYNKNCDRVPADISKEKSKEICIPVHGADNDPRLIVRPETGTSTAKGEGGISGDIAVPNLQVPLQNIVRQPRRKKPVDPFIRPKKRP